MGRTSRYPEPGSMASAVWETNDLRTCVANVVVMATSRHKRMVTYPEALELLRTEYGPEAVIDRVGTWRSITKADIENGFDCCVDDPEEGGWSEGASGQAFVTVAYPNKEAVDAW